MPAYCLCIYSKSIDYFGTFSIAEICEEINCSFPSGFGETSGQQQLHSVSRSSFLPPLALHCSFFVTLLGLFCSQFLTLLAVWGSKFEKAIPVLAHMSWAKFFIWNSLASWLIITFIWSLKVICGLFCFNAPTRCTKLLDAG